MAIARPSKRGICQETGPPVAWTFTCSGDFGRPRSALRNPGCGVQVVSDCTNIQAQAG
uniref:Uncharacterized protein n=1 Tax=Hyaloperonospora arabidopsidis (strain Emoy2) TaxID=559515 RepID=M4BS68_HYAAE